MTEIHEGVLTQTFEVWRADFRSILARISHDRRAHQARILF